MDDIIVTLVFLLPGFLMYFWLQAFGINPVIKHSPAEFTAVSALLWLPVSVSTILLYNLIIKCSYYSNSHQIWKMDELNKNSNSILFLMAFLSLSALVSFIMSVIWSKYLFPVQLRIINRIRKWRGIAAFSKTPSVWDEVFTNNDSQVVEVGRIDKAGMSMIGGIHKASRTFEPERNLHLEEVDFFTKLVGDHKIPVSHIFYDIKSGSYVKIFDAESIREAQKPPISLVVEG